MSVQDTGVAIAPEKRYGFAAFISYRHVEPDRRWAKWLHSSLETYRIPKRLREQYRLGRQIGRVFRDEEEFSASANLKREIEDHLQQSRFLIVVCSPHTPESLWVNAEVIRFREMGRGDQILALLIDGEPSESFPPALREIRGEVMDTAGALSVVAESVEPLAVDLRPSPGESLRTAKRRAKLRLLAPILGCRYDDLRQRDQERQTRIYAYAAAALALVLGIVGSLGAFAWYQWKETERQRLVGIWQSAARQAIRDSADHADDDRMALLARQATAFHSRTSDQPRYLVENALVAATYTKVFSHVLLGHGEAVRSVAFAPDGNRLASAGFDNIIRVWDLRHPSASPEVLLGHELPVLFVAFAADGNRLASASF